MSTDLLPDTAASLALAVYTLNAGVQRDLKAFLARREFSQGSSQTTLQAKTGGRIFRASKDGFGLCATGAGQYKGDLFLIFRGTTTANNNADMVTDARIGIERSTSGLPVHIGFNHTFKSMLPEIRSFIAESKITGTVHCIGHSLGGAVATLAADWAASSLSLPVKLYTFGQPRVGLTFFSSMLTQKLGSKNIHRVFHTTDPVPMVPVFPYLHTPLPGYGHRKISENPIISGEAHRMTAYTKGLGNSWESLVSAPPINNHEAAIEEWLRSNANSNPMCPKTFEWLENAIIWLLKKQLSTLTVGLQWAAMGIHTFLDKVAWILAKGIEIGEKCAEYVKLFIRKVMKILGLNYQEGVTSISHAFLRYLLQSLVKRANDLAINAIRGLAG
ncbi:MAG: lipase family protein [Agarilytica sp.]